MSTAPNLSPTQAAAHDEALAADEATLQLANRDESVVNRLAAVRGTIGGLLVGAAVWAGLILAGAALIRK